jgi:hypothetical protein
MRVYQGQGYEGVSIVNYGLTINVTDGTAIVDYDGVTADYYETLKSGTLSGRVDGVNLQSEQLAWLENSKSWVKNQIDGCQ